MSDDPARQILLDCRRSLSRAWGALLHRPTIRKIDSYLRMAAVRVESGGRVIERARLDADRFERVAIDAEEVETRPHPSGVQVRAWFLVPNDTLALLEARQNDESGAQVRLSPLTREIVALRARAGLSVGEIAYRKSIPVWRVRWHLRRGVKEIARSIRDQRQ